MFKMAREVINSNTAVSELIKQIKETETSHTFHLKDDLKIVLTALRKCSNCSKWIRNGDMEGSICWSCAEAGRKIADEPQAFCNCGNSLNTEESQRLGICGDCK